MGISCLVSTGKREVLDRFAFEIANIWLDVLCEIKEQEEQKEDDRYVLVSVSGISNSPSPASAGIDCPYSSLSLFWDKPFEEIYHNIEDTSEYERRRVVSSRPRSGVNRRPDGLEGD